MDIRNSESLDSYRSSFIETITLTFRRMFQRTVTQDTAKYHCSENVNSSDKVTGLQRPRVCVLQRKFNFLRHVFLPFFNRPSSGNPEYLSRTERESKLERYSRQTFGGSTRRWSFRATTFLVYSEILRGISLMDVEFRS